MLIEGAELDRPSPPLFRLLDPGLAATGKIDRAGLKKMAEEHLHPHLAG